MQSTVIPVDHIPPLEHDEAMRLAQAEYQRSGASWSTSSRPKIGPALPTVPVGT